MTMEGSARGIQKALKDFPVLADTPREQWLALPLVFRHQLLMGMWQECSRGFLTIGNQSIPLLDKTFYGTPQRE